MFERLAGLDVLLLQRSRMRFLFGQAHLQAGFAFGVGRRRHAGGLQLVFGLSQATTGIRQGHLGALGLRPELRSLLSQTLGGGLVCLALARALGADLLDPNFRLLVQLLGQAGDQVLQGVGGADLVARGAFFGLQLLQEAVDGRLGAGISEGYAYRVNRRVDAFGQQCPTGPLHLGLAHAACGHDPLPGFVYCSTYHACT